MILLDTTVLVYAVGSDHALRHPCRSLIAAVGNGQVRATTTVEVIQEFVHVRSRRRGRTDAAALGRQFADLLSPEMSADRDDLDAALDIFVEHDRLGAFDAVLAAIVHRREHLSALVSADAAFAEVGGLVHVDPTDADAMNGLLGER